MCHMCHVQIRYPVGLRYPDFDRTKGKQKADRVDQSGKSPGRRRFPAKPSKSKGSFKRKPKSVKQVEMTSNDPGPSEPEPDPVNQDESSSDDDDGNHNASLAIDFGSIVITPPPSPPDHTAQEECLECSDS